MGGEERDEWGVGWGGYAVISVKEKRKNER
jgi:hypothetical protein